MKILLHKGLLILMMFALALAPLRAAWAMPTSTTTDTADHCAQMQSNVQATGSGSGHHPQDTDSHSEYPCYGCCGSDCNAANCNACAHGTSAISSFISAVTDIPASPLDLDFAYRYPERSLTPPLRPPAFL